MKKAIGFAVAILLFQIPWNASAGECKEHIALHSAKYLANEYGKTEMYIISNIKINLWEKPTHHGKGKKVGHMYPGSHALILKTDQEDYQVRSPLDGSVGWINTIQVSKTLFQDTETREACTP